MTLAHEAGPPHVVTTCIEWEPAFANDQLAQTQALAAALADRALDGALPVVLTADLNAAPDSPQVRALTDRMIDTWIAGGRDVDGVTLSSDNPSASLDGRAQLDRRIDYVLVRPGRPDNHVRLERAFVEDTPVDGLPPSDHYAVVADLAISCDHSGGLLIPRHVEAIAAVLGLPPSRASRWP